jgi:hypothetical protein
LDSSDGVWLGNELEEEEDTTYTRAPRGSDTERRRRARRLWLRTVGPAHYAVRGRKEKGQLRRLAWAKEELGQRLQPSGPGKKRRQQRPSAGCEARSRPKGRKLERREEGDFLFLLFLF